MKKALKKRASAPSYVSPSQLSLEGFETPFSKTLSKENRWVKLAQALPWDEICNIYTKQVGLSQTGRPPISARVVIGALIIKHICNLDDRETVAHITENMYMQYFLGYSSFSPDPPFDPNRCEKSFGGRPHSEYTPASRASDRAWKNNCKGGIRGEDTCLTG